MDLENFWTGLSSGGSKTLRYSSVSRFHAAFETPYKHLSSTTLMIERKPFWESFGVGAAASEPSPKKRVPSSIFASEAASRIVKGRTRTATEMEEAPSSLAIAALRMQAKDENRRCKKVLQLNPSSNEEVEKQPTNVPLKFEQRQLNLRMFSAWRS
jgi:hypothetical protein